MVGGESASVLRSQIPSCLCWGRWGNGGIPAACRQLLRESVCLVCHHQHPSAPQTLPRELPQLPLAFNHPLSTCADLRLRKLHCLFVSMCVTAQGLSWCQVELCGVPAPWGPRSVPQGLLPSSFWDSHPTGDLQALCEQGAACKMGRSWAVTPGWRDDTGGIPAVTRLLVAAPSPCTHCRPCPACRNLVRLVLLCARPNPAQGQQLALGANCCTAIAHPAISAWGAAQPGLVPTISSCQSRNQLVPGTGQRLRSACPSILEELAKEPGEVRRWPGAFPSGCDSPLALSVLARPPASAPPWGTRTLCRSVTFRRLVTSCCAEAS